MKSYSSSEDKDRIYEQIVALNAEIAVRQAKVNALETELKALFLRPSTPTPILSNKHAVVRAGKVGIVTPPESYKDLTGKKRGQIGRAIGEVVASILKTTGRPMRAEEIYKTAIEQGYKFPGASPCTNMAAHLYHQKRRFVLNERKEWTLTAANGDEP